jgi:nitrate reductase gamma subunit
MDSARSLLDWLPYLTAAVFVFGLARRIVRWSRAPAPAAPLFPLPGTRRRAVARLAAEICLLRGRAAGSVSSRLPAWLFHASLVLLLVGHVRAVTDFPGLWAALALSPAAVDRLATVAGGAAGLLALGSALALAVRRAVVPGLRDVTGLEDVCVLALLVAVIGSGLAMRLGPAVDLAPVRAYLADLARLRPRPMPDVPGFALHFLLAQALVAAIPFGKLLHLAGVFPAMAGDRRDPARDREGAGPLWAASHRH